jgi:hypothetical protein
MALTKRQQKLVVLFLIGLVALGIDRVFLRPQGGAHAASADALPASDPSILPSDNVPVPEEEPNQPGLVERLNALWPSDETRAEPARDPFSLPGSWSHNVGNSKAGTPDVAAVFTNSHRLTAVVLDPRRSYALVNDHFLIPGQSLDGFQLVSVGPRSATFERDSRQVVLQLVNP